MKIVHYLSFLALVFSVIQTPVWADEDDFYSLPEEEAPAAAPEVVEQQAPPAAAPEVSQAEEPNLSAPVENTEEVPLLTEPAEVMVQESQNDIVRETATEEVSSLNGQPPHVSVQALTDYDDGLGRVNWKMGLGGKYYLENNVMLFAHIEHLLLSHLAVGFAVGSFGEDQISGTIKHGVDVLGTLNFYSAERFRGLHIQAGGGLLYIKTTAAAGDATVAWKPTLMGNLGWRWGLADDRGRDDDFSLGVSVGMQAIFDSVQVGPAKNSSVAVLPNVRVEFNFAF